MNSIKKICLSVFFTSVFLFSFTNVFAQQNDGGNFFGDFSIRIYCTFATLIPQDDNKYCQTDIFVKDGLPANLLFPNKNTGTQTASSTNVVNNISTSTNVTYVNPVTRVVNETRVVYIPATTTSLNGLNNPNSFITGATSTSGFFGFGTNFNYNSITNGAQYGGFKDGMKEGLGERYNSFVRAAKNLAKNTPEAHEQKKLIAKGLLLAAGVAGFGVIVGPVLLLALKEDLNDSMDEFINFFYPPEEEGEGDEEPEDDWLWNEKESKYKRVMASLRDYVYGSVKVSRSTNDDDEAVEQLMKNFFTFLKSRIK
jgi:hypothetical protein